MGRMNVYMTDELEAQMRKAKLKPSKLLQMAVKRELQMQARRRALKRGK